MSTEDKSREEFEAWCLRGKPADAWTNWQLCWQAARQSALEEAAKVCEDIADEFNRSEGGKWPELKSDAQTGASQCEAALRALAQTQEGQEP